jgi:hypothetical protein
MSPWMAIYLRPPGDTRQITTQISNLNFPYEPSDVRRHLYLCGFGRGEDGLEVHTQWMRNKISLFSSLSMLL